MPKRQNSDISKQPPCKKQKRTPYPNTPVMRVTATEKQGKLWLCTFALPVMLDDGTIIEPEIVSVPKAAAKKLCDKDTIYNFVNRVPFGCHGIFLVKWVGFSKQTVEPSEDMEEDEFLGAIEWTLHDLMCHIKATFEADVQVSAANCRDLKLLIRKYNAISTDNEVKEAFGKLSWLF